MMIRDKFFTGIEMFNTKVYYIKALNSLWNLSYEVIWKN